MGKEQILTMADYSNNYAKQYKDFIYPTENGLFTGQLVLMHWTTHAIIHSFWELENGSKIDCPVFRDSALWSDIQNFNIGDRATVVLKRAGSGKIYMRGLVREKLAAARDVPK